MILTDWLGYSYGPGDTVIYPVMSGRCVEMQMAEVVDIWTVYMCPKDYKWKRLEEGAEVPTKTFYAWDRSGDAPVRHVDEIKPVETQLRVRLQPVDKGSRKFGTRTDSKSVWVAPDGTEVSFGEMHRRLEAEHGLWQSEPVWNPHIYKYEGQYKRNWEHEDFGYVRKVYAVKPKPVTLTAGINNITLLR